MAVAAGPDEMSVVPGRYGWDGATARCWCNDPHRDLIAMAFTQTTDFLFNGGRAEFSELALSGATKEPSSVPATALPPAGGARVRPDQTDQPAVTGRHPW